MKQTILAAAAAFLLVLSACTPTTLPADVPVEPEKPASSAAATQPSDSSATTLPAEENAAQPVVDAWFDEPQTIQHDLDEVVTYTYQIPQLTLASAEASEKINEDLTQLQAALESYAEDTVYPAALDAQAIAFVNGSYQISMEDGILTLEYQVSVRYGAEGAEEITTRSYQFDAATGERLDG